jgi:histone H3/H4
MHKKKTTKSIISENVQIIMRNLSESNIRSPSKASQLMQKIISENPQPSKSLAGKASPCALAPPTHHYKHKLSSHYNPP